MLSAAWMGAGPNVLSLIREAGITALSQGATVIQVSLICEKYIPGEETFCIFSGDMTTITTGLCVERGGMGPRKEGRQARRHR